jgi:hypothetical protein
MAVDGGSEIKTMVQSEYVPSRNDARSIAVKGISSRLQEGTVGTVAGKIHRGNVVGDLAQKGQDSRTTGMQTPAGATMNVCRRNQRC